MSGALEARHMAYAYLTLSEEQIWQIPQYDLSLVIHDGARVVYIVRHLERGESLFQTILKVGSTAVLTSDARGVRPHVPPNFD